MPLFHRACRIISGRYLATESTWAPQQSIEHRWKQFLGLFGEERCERKGGSWQGFQSLFSWKVESQTYLVEAQWEIQHPNITPAKWGWTKKNQVITLGVQTYCEKSLTPQPIQSFHKQCEKASSDLCFISVVSREAVCFHMHSVHHTAHWGRLSADAVRYCHQGWVCGFLYHSQHISRHCELSFQKTETISLHVSYLKCTLM